MPTTRMPRSGSLQMRPRRKIKGTHARVRSWPETKEAQLQGFAGYKVGMTHVTFVDTRKNSLTQKEEVSMPVTVVECPPLRVVGVRAYAPKGYGQEVVYEERTFDDKYTRRKLPKSKTASEPCKDWDASKISRVCLIVATQPHLSGVGKKTPEIFEVQVGGDAAAAIEYAKTAKEISLSDVFQAGEYIDAHSLTKGKGFQGPVARDGIGLRSHKAEKARRLAVLGPEGFAKVRWSAHQGGKSGYHQRTEYNKQIMMIDEQHECPQGGYLGYGITKQPCLLVHGSLGGARSRLIRFVKGIRIKPKRVKQLPTIRSVSTASKQGN